MVPLADPGMYPASWNLERCGSADELDDVSDDGLRTVDEVERKAVRELTQVGGNRR